MMNVPLDSSTLLLLNTYRPIPLILIFQAYLNYHQYNPLHIYIGLVYIVVQTFTFLLFSNKACFQYFTKYCDEYVCLSVSARRTTRPNFTKFL